MEALQVMGQRQVMMIQQILEGETDDLPPEPDKRPSIFDTWAEKFKQFLDNAE